MQFSLTSSSLSSLNFLTSSVCDWANLQALLKLLQLHPKVKLAPELASPMPWQAQSFFEFWPHCLCNKNMEKTHYL